MAYTVKRLKVGKTEQLDALARECGCLYTQTVVRFWRTVRHKGLWLKPSSMMRWLNSDHLHAHTADACVQAFFAALKAWRALRQTNPDAKPPHKLRKFFRIEYKNTAIRLRDGQLVLSNGLGNAPLVLAWRWDCPRTVVIHWDGEQYEAIATYTVPVAEPVTEGRAVGIDLGEVHLAAVSDGWLVNGRHLRSLRQLQNKTKARFQAAMDRKGKRSRRWKRLARAKGRALRRIDHRIRDVLHKSTTGIVNTLKRDGCKTLVVGDLRGLRIGNDKGKAANQKIHQWAFGQTTWQLRYKAERAGLSFVWLSEAYTSQTCPRCGARHKPNGRVYRCPSCGFSGHRDYVGAHNILSRYQGCGPVIGSMARPTGVRFQPHLRVARGFSLNRVQGLREAAGL